MKTAFKYGFPASRSWLRLRAHYVTGFYWLGSTERNWLMRIFFMLPLIAAFFHMGPSSKFCGKELYCFFFHQKEEMGCIEWNHKNSALLRWVSCKWPCVRRERIFRLCCWVDFSSWSCLTGESHRGAFSWPWLRRAHNTMLRSNESVSNASSDGGCDSINDTKEIACMSAIRHQIRPGRVFGCSKFSVCVSTRFATEGADKHQNRPPSLIPSDYIFNPSFSP